jgi:hypothetical protein
MTYLNHTSVNVYNVGDISGKFTLLLFYLQPHERQSKYIILKLQDLIG